MFNLERVAPRHFSGVHFPFAYALRIQLVSRRRIASLAACQLGKVAPAFGSEIQGHDKGSAKDDGADGDTDARCGSSTEASRATSRIRHGC